MTTGTQPLPQIQRETGTSLSEINMVPFIDVVLVLLIIFMITAPILQSGIEVDVPKTKTVKELTECAWWLRLTGRSAFI